jgi:hypothetical protein
MFNRFVLLLIVAVVAVVCATNYPVAAPTFEAKDYTTWHKTMVKKSKRADIRVDFKAADGSDDYVSMTRVDLVGNVYDRGYAHGYLLAKGECQYQINPPSKCLEQKQFTFISNFFLFSFQKSSSLLAQSSPSFTWTKF